MRRPATRTRTQRLHGDRGGLTIELAMVAPFFVVLLLGIFEFGNVYRNQNLVASATRAATRVESQQIQTQSIDWLALSTFSAGTNNLKNMTLVKVIIYNAPANGKVSTSCLNASTGGSPPYGISGSCAVYSASQVTQVKTTPFATIPNFGCGGLTTGSTWDSMWCPAARSNAFTEPMPRVGVYAVYSYQDVTNLFPTSTMTISDYAVYSIQPSV